MLGLFIDAGVLHTDNPPLYATFEAVALCTIKGLFAGTD